MTWELLCRRCNSGKDRAASRSRNRLTVPLLPVVLWKTVELGQGDVQVFFRAGWALWTGYPLYEVTSLALSPSR